MTYARAIVAGEDLYVGDVLIEKNGRAYAIRNNNTNQEWIGFAMEDALKGKSVRIIPRLDLVGG